MDILEFRGQYNPYRVTVKMERDYIDKYGGGLLGNGTITVKMEALTVRK